MANPKYRPSDASRWTYCTASPQYIAQLAEDGLLPEEEAKDYADEGSRAHELAAQLLTGKARGDDDDPYVLAYVDFVSALVRSEADDLLVEQRVGLYYDKEANGYVDACVVHPEEDAIDIVDLKFGRGVVVQARGNPQIAIYAKSILQQLEDDLIYESSPDTIIQLIIYQPRTEGIEQAVKKWVLTRAELDEWLAENVTRYYALDPSEQVFRPSEDTCRFCPAKGICRAYVGYCLGEYGEGESVAPDQLMTAKPATEMIPEPVDFKTLSVAQMDKILQVAPRLKKWLNELEQYVTSARIPLENFKFVEARTMRKWADEDAALQFLRKYYKVGEVTTKKVISVAQAEKLMAKLEGKSPKVMERFQSLILKPEGAVTLAPLSDPRQAILTAEQEFGDTVAATTAIPHGTKARTVCGTPVTVLEAVNQRHYRVRKDGPQGGEMVMDVDDIVLPINQEKI